jgi:hypothetical protein
MKTIPATTILTGKTKSKIKNIKIEIYKEEKKISKKFMLLGL